MKKKEKKKMKRKLSRWFKSLMASQRIFRKMSYIPNAGQNDLIFCPWSLSTESKCNEASKHSIEPEFRVYLKIEWTMNIEGEQTSIWLLISKMSARSKWHPFQVLQTKFEAIFQWNSKIFIHSELSKNRIFNYNLH